jgi:hypothetical protein
VKLVRISQRVDGAECLAEILWEWVGGGDGLHSGLEVGGAVAADGFDEFLIDQPVCASIRRLTASAANTIVR